MKLYVVAAIAIVNVSCAMFGGQGNTTCSAGMLSDNGYPCWVNRTPDKGIVVSMAEAVDPNKTREMLFNKALVEIAAAEYGVNVSEDSIVKKSTKVNGSNVSQQSQVITLATVNTANGSVKVKAKIEDLWKHPTSRKLYMWVVPVK